jgi:hypothetical protein
MKLATARHTASPGFEVCMTPSGRRRSQSQQQVLGPDSRPVQGRLWLVLGWSLVIASLVAALIAADQGVGDGFVLLLALPLALARWMILKGKRLAAKRAEQVLAEDTRPPVVYLRSFRDEDADKGLAGVLQSGAATAGKPLAHSIVAWGTREQEALAVLLGQVGPYVAVGKPGEPVPEVGAARMYLHDDKWQAEASKLIGEARLIVVRAGATEGLRWEVGQLVRRARPTTLLFVLPTIAEQYAGFRRWASEVLPQPLPVAQPEGRLLVFDPDWRPNVLPAQRTLRLTLEPFLRSNGIELEGGFLADVLEHNSLR